MLFLKNLIKTNSLLCCIFFILGCSGNKNTEINLLYLYDISGSYHQKSLKESVRISENIFNSIISNDGIPFKPQTHQVSTIDGMSVNIGGNCNTRITQENIFETEIKSPGDDFKSCLKSIVDSKPSKATDLRGALATASKTLQNDDLRGKGVIIFSDLHEYGEVKKDYPLDLNGVCFYVIVEWADYQIKNPDLIKIDENKFIDMLLNAGVSRSDIKIMPLSSVATSPDMVAKWFRKKF